MGTRGLAGTHGLTGPIKEDLTFRRYNKVNLIATLAFCATLAQSKRDVKPGTNSPRLALLYHQNFLRVLILSTFDKSDKSFAPPCNAILRVSQMFMIEK